MKKMKCKNIKCSDCMQGAPYPFCCHKECGEHEFCKGCNFCWTLSTQDAFQILIDTILGENYYITDSMGGKQANAVILEDILSELKIDH